VTVGLSRILIVVAAVPVLAAVNLSIAAKERVIAGGERIYLQLAPVDPRSLMQGDYMALRFSIASLIDTRVNGKAPLVVDEQGVATIAAAGAPARLHIRFKIRDGQVWLGTNAYFFEEGSAQRLDGARYGEFRVDPESGEAVLVGLRDKDFKSL
jgi:uncharacterized membrane-anchored protein